MASGQFGISQHVERREDARLLTGGGAYADDTGFEGQAYAAFLRAPIGHGDIRSVDTSEAENAPGVIAVYTGKDLQDAGIGPIPNVTPFPNRDGSEMLRTQRPAVAVDVIKHVGEIVAVVVAESTALAQDAVDLIMLDVDPLPAITDVRDAIKPDAPQLHDHIPGNVCLDFQIGDEAKAKAAVENAAHVVELTLTTNRLAVAAMEPRSAAANFDPDANDGAGCYELITGSQGVNAMRNMLAGAIFDVPHEQMHVRTNDVGGGFGMKTQAYPEYVAILFAARACGKPVKWQGTRSEAFLADNQARDGVMNGTMAFDEDGKILGFRVDMIAAMGGYLSSHGPAAATRNVCNCLTGCYDNPALEFQVKCLMTNNIPIGPYRGAGRPEAAYILERMMDHAARQLGIDRVELRRRNFIRPEQMPYTTSLGQVYDSGEFEAAMDKALELAEWDSFEKRRAESEANGKLRGIGISCFVETAGGMLQEGAKLAIGEDGTVEARLAVQSNGQGHATSFAQVVSELLQVPYEKVRIIEGDSFQTPGTGFASVASRSMALASGAISLTADAMIDKGKKLAGHVLEAAEADIEYADGIFTVTGTDRAVGIFELEAKAKALGELPDGVPESLDSEEDFDSPEQTYPNGCHICEVEIEPETGVIDVLNYVAVDDCGTVINPMIVHGQVHGGVAQGLGQVLGEHAIYDSDGQLLAGSFMDYFMPRADDMPDMKLGFHSVKCTTNPVGAKGAGEAGTTGALAAGMNAIIDALAARGITEFDMPATPPRVWAALHKN
ncbi:MAG: xanthine dehydrogenase family protein molybdopterin-binding subunit [Alphaproteobacteria bacterium]|nr:xanthine dehydrogenase family protein molybdopterin-binding subunit [Alphaproteobacteria bacterium]